LIVQVDPVVHAVMTNYWLLGLDHRFDDERETHLVNPELILRVLRGDLLLDVIRGAVGLSGACRLAALVFGFFLLLGCGRVVGRPLELLASKDVEVEIVDGLVWVLTIVHHDTVALDVFFAANPANCDHHMAQKCLVLRRLPHINQ